MSDLKTWSKTNKDWTDDFILELRALEAPGYAIGDQLTTVYAHCQETGETPQEAFGNARQYAQSLGYAAPTSRLDLAAIVTPSLLTLLAMFVFNYGISALANNHPYMLNAGVIACWGAAALLVLCLAIIPYRVLVHNLWILVAGAVLAAALGIGGAIISRMDWPLIINTDPVPVIIGSALLMLIGASLATRVVLKDSDQEAIVNPLDSPAEQIKANRKTRLVGVLGCWILPIYAALSALIWLLV